MKSVSEKILDAIQKFYTAFTNQRVLTTSEEVMANTNEKNLASAVVVGELYHNLTESFQVGCNAIVNKLKELGVTPESNSPDDIVKAIETIYNNNKCSGGKYYIRWAGPGTTAANVQIWHNGNLVFYGDYYLESEPISGTF